MQEGGTSFTYNSMFRLTRPLFQALKQSTGITGLAVHPNPLPELIKTYNSTLSILSTIPTTSVYRQGTEALTRHKLNIVQTANGDIGAAEKKLNEGQIEESLEIASDELELAQKMVEWKACVAIPLILVFFFFILRTYLTNLYLCSWQDPVDVPEPGQWEYIGKST